MCAVEDTSVPIVEPATNDERNEHACGSDIRDGRGDQAARTQSAEQRAENELRFTDVFKNVGEDEYVIVTDPVIRKLVKCVEMFEIELGNLVQHEARSLCRVLLELNPINRLGSARSLKGYTENASTAADIEHGTAPDGHELADFGSTVSIVGLSIQRHDTTGRREPGASCTTEYSDPVSSSSAGRRATDLVRPLGARMFRLLPQAIRVSLGSRLAGAGLTAPSVSDLEHPERLAVLEHAVGDRVVEVGCGPRKTDDGFVGVDLTPGGVDGLVGNARGRPSEADLCADGRALPIRTNSVDCVVARHNLEHYVDTIAVLREWDRILVPGGRGIFVVPDEDAYEGRTVELDPTHFHSFNASYLSGLLDLLGWSVIMCEPCVPNWSLIVVAETAVTATSP